MKVIRFISSVLLWVTAAALCIWSGAFYLLTLNGGPGAGMAGAGLLILGGIYVLPAAAAMLVLGLVGRLIGGRAP